MHRPDHALTNTTVSSVSSRCEGTRVAAPSDLTTKLQSVDDWVLQEFLLLEDLLEGLGCAGVEESGPGRSYRGDGLVCARVHPKQHHLGIGLPNVLRPDVDALNRSPRRQLGAAWLHYDRATCDRDTLTALILKAADVPALRAGAARAVPGTHDGQRDEADLTLLLELLAAFRSYESMRGAPATLKVLREAVFFHWEGPRLPPGGKYSRALPHSPDARQWRNDGKRGGLVYEHVLPISLVLRGLLSRPPVDTTQLRQRLTEGPSPVLITKDEDVRLNAAGLRNAVPEGGDAWSRYRAIGLDERQFQPLSA